MSTLEYYFENGSHVIFEKYTIDTSGIVRNKKTGDQLSTHKLGKYNVCDVRDNRKRRIRVCRALASTFRGRPPTLEHTADHEDRNRDNDTLDNIRWLCKSSQSKNQDRPETYKNATFIVKDGLEKTTKEWVVYLKNKKNSLGREYTANMINKYASQKQHGFSYKEYPNLPGEVWKEIINSKSTIGHWEISNMNRVKCVTKYAENVISGERLGLDNGYPRFVLGQCHILAFMTFFPEEYAARKPGEIILHEDDDRLDFRPQKLRLGTSSDNSTDAHDNGKHDGTKSMRMTCASYINGVLEKEHISQTDAAKYLKSRGFDKVSDANISKAMGGTYKSAYGRTWQKI